MDPDRLETQCATILRSLANSLPDVTNAKPISLCVGKLAQALRSNFLSVLVFRSKLMISPGASWNACPSWQEERDESRLLVKCSASAQCAAIAPSPRKSSSVNCRNRTDVNFGVLFSLTSRDPTVAGRKICCGTPFKGVQLKCIVARKRPRDMLAHERRGMTRTPLDRRDDLGVGWCVA